MTQQGHQCRRERAVILSIRQAGGGRCQATAVLTNLLCCSTRSQDASLGTISPMQHGQLMLYRARGVSGMPSMCCCLTCPCLTWHRLCRCSACKHDKLPSTGSACLVKLLFLLALVVHALADDLLGHLATNDSLHDWLQLTILEVLIQGVLQAQQKFRSSLEWWVMSPASYFP